MEWVVTYLPEAEKDIDKLDGSPRKMVFKAIEKVRENPKSQTEGGYGKPLGNKGGNNLTGLFKIKLRSLGLRVVYRLEEIPPENIMRIIVVSVREDNEVYDLAAERIKK